MKQLSTVLVILLIAFQSRAQSKWKELALDRSAYQSRGIDVQLFKETYEGLEGQQYTTKISNLTAKKIKVAGSLLAITYCGNRVSLNFSITVSPGKTLGGNDYLFDNDGLTGIVLNTDCHVEKTYPNPGDKTTYRYDRIRSVGVGSMTITPIADEVVPSSIANNTPRSTATSAAARPQTNGYTYTPPGATRQQTQSISTPPASTGNTATKAISDGLTSLSNSVTQMYAERQRQRDEQTAKDNQAAAERREREQAEQEERDRQQREETQRRTQELDNGLAEKEREDNLDKQIAGTNYIAYAYAKPRDVENKYPNAKAIYYFAFCRMGNEVTLMPPMTVAKYSDDTWIQGDKLINKIAINFGNTGKMFSGDVFSNRLAIMGYFMTAADADAACKTIREKSITAGYSVRIVDTGRPAPANKQGQTPASKAQPDKDFWNN